MQPCSQVIQPQHASVTQIAVALEASQSESAWQRPASGALPQPEAQAVRCAVACDRHTSPASPQSASEWQEPAG